MGRGGLRGRGKVIPLESLDDQSRETAERLEASQVSTMHQDVVTLSYEVNV